ncbi:MAG: AtpZ/AtpI family protein [Dehalococcoidia bacterium]
MTDFSKSESRGGAPGGRWQPYLPALRLLGIGWFFATAVLVGVGGGYWLDQLTGWSPILTLIGVVLALVIAIFGAYRMIVPLLGRPVNGGGGVEG